MPILYTTPGVGIPVTVTFGPNVTDALQLFKVVEMLILVAVIVGGLLTVIDFVALAVPQLLVTVYLMVAVPGATPVTTPVPEFTVATAVLLLLQLPPLVPLLVNVVVDPTQTVAAPLTVPAFGSGFTVSALVAVVEHPPLVTVYLTVTVPAVKPVTTRVDVFILAEPVPFNIDQVPPAVASVKAGVVAPTHTVAAPPPIAATVGKAFTVSDLVTVVVPQPVTEYLTVTVPAVTPVAIPPAFMVAEPVPFNIDQVPPAVASVKAGVVESGTYCRCAHRLLPLQPVLHL